jgi:deazaflavin-dependent oxidoreductase (nitroreductase family)
VVSGLLTSGAEHVGVVIRDKSPDQDHVIGRKSGHTISIPVWFVVEGDKLYLLPVQGSDTQWYKNVLRNPSIRIDARGVGVEFRAVPLTDVKAVKSVVEKFREKYGAKDVKKYYSKFDVAVLLETMRWPS